MKYTEAGHPNATDLTRAFSPGNSDAMDILTLGLGRVLELGRQDVPGVGVRASGCPWPQEYRSEFSRVRSVMSGCRGPEIYRVSAKFVYSTVKFVYCKLACQQENNLPSSCPNNVARHFQFTGLASVLKIRVWSQFQKCIVLLICLPTSHS